MLEATFKIEETLDSPPAWRDVEDSNATDCPAFLLVGLEYLRCASAGCQEMGRFAAFVTQCALSACRLFSPLLLLGIVDVNGLTHPCDDTSRLEKTEESDGESATTISTGCISGAGGAV